MSAATQDHPVPIECPHCGRVNDMHAEPGLAAPTQGDLGICWGCRSPYFFELTSRRPLPEEMAELEADPEYRATLAAMAESYTPSEATALRPNPESGDSYEASLRLMELAAHVVSPDTRVHPQQGPKASIDDRATDPES